MAIEINGSPQAQPQVTGSVGGHANTPARPETGTVARDAGRNSGAPDTVSITDTAQQLRGLEHNLAQQPVVDTQRVEATRQAIENGTYEINPERIAGKMMDLERALAGAR